jgi:hypothetical protein
VGDGKSHLKPFDYFAHNNQLSSVIFFNFTHRLAYIFVFCSLGMLSIESKRAKALKMSTFVDVFVANHKNSRIRYIYFRFVKFLLPIII